MMLAMITQELLHIVGLRHHQRGKPANTPMAGMDVNADLYWKHHCASHALTDTHSSLCLPAPCLHNPCSHRGRSPSEAAQRVGYETTFKNLAMHGVVCADLDVFTTGDGALLVGHIKDAKVGGSGDVGWFGHAGDGSRICRPSAVVGMFHVITPKYIEAHICIYWSVTPLAL